MYVLVHVSYDHECVSTIILHACVIRCMIKYMHLMQLYVLGHVCYFHVCVSICLS